MAELIDCVAGVWRFYKSVTPVQRGSWRVERVLSRWASSKSGTSPRRIRTRHGFLMDVALTDFVQRQIYVTGAWEPETGDAIVVSLGRGDVFVDIGANVGYFSLLAARNVGAEGRVLARHPPDIVCEVSEWSLQQMGASRQALYDLLARFGYSGRNLSPVRVGKVVDGQVFHQYDVLFSARR